MSLGALAGLHRSKRRSFGFLHLRSFDSPIDPALLIPVLAFEDLWLAFLRSRGLRMIWLAVKANRG